MQVADCKIVAALASRIEFSVEFHQPMNRSPSVVSVFVVAILIVKQVDCSRFFQLFGFEMQEHEKKCK